MRLPPGIPSVIARLQVRSNLSCLDPPGAVRDKAVRYTERLVLLAAH